MIQDDFVEKNQKGLANNLDLIIQITKQLFEKSCIEKLTPKRTSKTSASSLKFEIDSLMEKLKNTVIN